MARTVSIGTQDFGQLRENGSFYVDKTSFIKVKYGFAFEGKKCLIKKG
ncbi:MAG: hypothetical protein IJ801_03060 [Lachnospiraceae bacterium]|nr:hypothetical protein [Lachnospiraceae bacterium]